MVPSGPPTPVGGAQTVAPSGTNSSLLGGQGGSIPAQPAFSPLVSPRTQYGNTGVLGNLSNVSSLLGGGGNAGIGVNPSFVGPNGPISSGPNPGLSGSGNMQRGGIGMNAESDALTGIGSGLAFNASPLPFASTNASAAISSGISGSMTASGGPHFPNQLSQDLPHPQQLEVQNFQHGQQGQDSSNSLQIQSQHIFGARSLQQFSAQNNIGLAASQQRQLQSLRALSGDPNGPQSLAPLRGLMPVKMEPQVANEQSAQQQMQSLRGLVPVKLEQQQQQQQHQHQQQQQQQQQQQITSLRNIPVIKSEPQHSDQSLLLQQQQQQQQLLQMSRQSPQQMQLKAAQMNLLQQQRLLQQQQQQQMFKTLPVQRSALQQQPIQQFQQHNMPLRSAIKPMYEPGTCARRLTQYLYHQQHRPADNSIDFWRKFVSEYFAPHAKKRWCVSLYGNGKQTTGVFPQDVWHCEICNIKPGRGFETTVEVLPRLWKIKYDSGTLEELLYVDMPREYHTASGHIVLDYGKAIQESVFEQLRVVRDGQLRVVFSMDLKICSWEFCARRHEELIPRRLILSQVSQLGTVAQKYQAASQNGSSSFTAQELQNTCNMFVKIARDLAKAMEVPLVNDLGYTKRYVRCLQISEVVNSMKDLIDYSRETKTGPMASLINFPKRTIALGGTNQCQQQQQEQQQQQQQEEQSRLQNEGSVQASSVQQLTQGNGVVGLTNLLNASPTSSSASTSTIAGLIHQNAINTRQDNQLNNGTGPFGHSVQISSAGSSISLQQSHPNPSSPFPNTVPSAPNPLPQSSIPPTAHSSSANSPANIPLPQPSHSGEVDPGDSQSSVQQIIQEIMMSSQLNAGGNMGGIGPMGNEMKSLNTMNMQTGNTSLKGTNCLVGNGISSGMGINSVGFGSMGGINPMAAVTMAGIRTPVPGNSVPTLNGRISMQSIPHQDPSMNHQQDMSNRFLSGLGSVNNFNNLQFDWKPSP